jgi:hypothetical protein
MTETPYERLIRDTRRLLAFYDESADDLSDEVRTAVENLRRAVDEADEP